jgi:preprotein translocase subunit SecF
MNLEKIYDKNYKKLLLVPIILLVLSLIILGVSYSSTGEFVKKDVSLKGGISITIEKPNLDQQEISSYMSERYSAFNVRTLRDLGTRQSMGLIIEASNAEEPELKSYLQEKIHFTEDEYSVEEYSSSFSESFFKQLVLTIIFAFLLMAIVVYVVFRTFIPSLAVVFAALSDIIVTLGVLSLFGMEISSGGIIALLLVIGYSIDTDILLTTRLLKRKIGTLYERLKGAIKTGLTMTVTTIAALSVAFIFSTAPVLKEIFLIILIALFVDIITTYLGNAPILLWYIKKKK